MTINIDELDREIDALAPFSVPRGDVYVPDEIHRQRAIAIRRQCDAPPIGPDGELLTPGEWFDEAKAGRVR